MSRLSRPRPDARRLGGLVLLLAALAVGCAADRVPSPRKVDVPEPKSDTDDWLRITSGEWLKGSLEQLIDGKLLFDSDEFDELTLDWDKVQELWAPAPMTCLRDNLESYTGPLHVVGDQVEIGSDPPLVFPRDNLIVIVREGTGGGSKWSGKATLGISSLTGNTDQQDLSAMLSLRRASARTMFKLDYNGLTSWVNDSRTASNHFLRTVYTEIVTRKLYYIPFYLDAWRDPFKNIEYQITPALLGGYKVLDESDQDWSAGAGLGVQFTKYSSVEAGEDDTERTPVFLILSEYEQDLTKDWDLSMSFSHQVEIGRAKAHTSRLMTRSTVDLTDRLDFDVTFIWSRIGNPQAVENGVDPKTDDYTLSLGLGFEF